MPGERQAVAMAVFGLTGLGFLPAQLLAFTTAVLHGLRRFDAALALSVAATLLRAAGIVALLAAGFGLLAVAAWQTLTAALVAAAGLAVVGQMFPAFRLRGGVLDWRLLRSRLPFAMISQLTSGAIDLVWQVIPVLIRVTRGSVAITPYHVGQRFPLAVSAFNWRAAEALFPAASRDAPQDLAQGRELLRTGTRWSLLLTVPLCLVLWIVAPSLLRAWLGEAPAEMLAVLRITSAAVAADALGVAAVQVLWAAGGARTVLLILGPGTLAYLALTAGLLAGLGLASVAWGLFTLMLLRSLLLLRAASRAYRFSAASLILESIRAMLLPVCVCAGAASALLYLVKGSGWAGVITTAAAATAAYGTALYFGPSREEERAFLRALFALPGFLVRLAGGRLQRALRRGVAP